MRKLSLGPHASPCSTHQISKSFSLGKQSCGSSSLETKRHPPPLPPTKEAELTVEMHPLTGKISWHILDTGNRLVMARLRTGALKFHFEHLRLRPYSHFLQIHPKESFSIWFPLWAVLPKVTKGRNPQNSLQKNMQESNGIIFLNYL